MGNLSGIPHLYDPQRLNTKGEGEAIIRKLRTFFVTADGSHLAPRTPKDIVRDPRPRWGYVIRSHRCGVPEPDPRGVKPDENPYDYSSPGF